MSAAPPIDAGDPSGLPRLWRLLISPTPGRLDNTMRVVVLALITVAIAETFRIPEVAISVYIVLFLSRAEAASTVMTALIGGGAVVTAVFIALGVLMFTLSQPALRIPVIACVTFGAMFLARTAGELGVPLFAAGFIVAYGLTLGDEVLGLALMPGSAANTAQFTLPELAFIPPEEALLRFFLWLALAVTIPVALVVVGNLLTGRNPALLLRAALTERLRAAALLCEGQSGADRRITALAREGVAGLLKLRHLAGLLHKSGQPAPVTETQRLLLLLLAAKRIRGEQEWRDRLLPIARFCRDAEQALSDGALAFPPAPGIDLPGAARPLGHEIGLALQAMHEPPAQAHPATTETRRLLSQDALQNPEYTRFALKVTLAVMICYATQSMIDWPGIHTCIITCFFVALGTVGETLHKATLRLAGCAVGAVLGIGTILLLMPVMTDLGDLLLVVAPVIFLSAWIGFGSERIGYAGWQMGLAFCLSTFQGFGPTLDMETARDRVVGLIFGNIVMFVVFTTIWPVRAGRVARTNLVKAVEHLAALFRTDDAEAAHRAGFALAIGQAQAVMLNEPFEAHAALTADGTRPIDAGILAQVQALFVPVSVILDLRREGPERAQISTYHAALANWFLRAAAWIRDGSGAADIMQCLPEPPESPGQPDSNEPLGIWHRLFYRDIRAILTQVEAGAGATRDVPAGEPSLATN